jgi:hypothetical protein
MPDSPGHLLHGLHQLPDLVPARRLGVDGQLTGGNALGTADHPLERRDHRTGDQPGRQHPTSSASAVAAAMATALRASSACIACSCAQ